MKIDPTQPALARVEFPGGRGSSRVRPLITPDTKPHYDGLRNGHLLLPECEACGHVGASVGACCQRCGSDKRRWRESSGAGVVHSWVRYHRAYLPEFEALVPYAVIAARLDDGPVMFGRWLSEREPTIESPVQGVIEHWADDFCGLAFGERRK